MGGWLNENTKQCCESMDSFLQVIQEQWIKQGSDSIQCVFQKIVFSEPGKEIWTETGLEGNYQYMS